MIARRPMLHRRTLGATLLLSTLAAVSPARAVVRDTAMPDQMTRDIPASFGGVGRVLNGGACTGAAIAPTVILSAAHCFEAARRPYLSPVASFTDRASGTRTAIIGVEIHPDWQFCAPSRCSDGTVRCLPSACFRGDLAVAHLAAPLPAWVPIYRLARFRRPPVGTLVSHVGYGQSGDGASGAVLPSGILRWGHNVITHVSPYRFFQTRFDRSGVAPCGAKLCSWTPLDAFKAREVTTAPGDSGGPVFYNPARDVEYALAASKLNVMPKIAPDEETIVGIVSHGTVGARYGSTGGYTFTGDYADWIAARAGIQPVTHDGPLVDVPDEGPATGEMQLVPPDPAVCANDLDDDGDGLADLDDPGCSDPRDDDEADEGTPPAPTTTTTLPSPCMTDPAACATAPVEAALAAVRCTPSGACESLVRRLAGVGDAARGAASARSPRTCARRLEGATQRARRLAEVIGRLDAAGVLLPVPAVTDLLDAVDAMIAALAGAVRCG